MRLYAYCVGDELAAETFEGATGVGGSPLMLVRRGAFAVVVSEFEGDAVPASRENVTEHNRVNALALARSTPLPFRFGTLVEDARLGAYLAKQEATLVAALGRVRGCVEMGAKVIWDAGGRAAGAVEEDEGEAGESPAAGAGTAFLLAKRREVLGEEALRSRAEGVAAALASRLEGLARESSVQVNPKGSLVVRAAHLIERGREEEYRERVRALGREREDLRLMASGPWPPYSFSGPRS
ncbi:MAG TPA: GvpL/GvpF family gas vesicle protein [Pyrinomonadaceae bacterium]|jgi:hypothetical protein|nr:GvpL/GvpF family gas vesicle protein [Pyrinomonadaceae bacterium]